MLPQSRKIALRSIRHYVHCLVALSLFLTITDAVAMSQNGPKLTGHVRHGRKKKGSTYGGDQPISGGHIYLFAVNESGYGLNPMSLLTTGSDVSFDNLGNGYVTTAADGSFSLTGHYSTTSCPTPDSRVYVLALGGDPGIGTNNPTIALTSALPVTCANLPNGGFIWINELTTVAAAFSLSGFANVNTNSFATSSVNLSNLNQGFTAANDLVNSSSGAVNSVTPDTSLPVPVAKINTIADVIAACVNTSGTTEACNTLFAAAKPPNGPYPTNTLQAAFDIAENVNNNVSAIFNLLPIPAEAEFEPTLTASPTDWTISATTPTTISMQPGATQIQANGAAWISASVNCNSACGTVEFRYDGQDVYAPVSLDSNGNALGYFPGWLGYGPHVVQAFYGGNNAYAASNSGSATIQILFPPTAASTTTTASADVNNRLPNGQVPVNAQVSCNTTCGYIVWYLDGIWLGTAGLDSAGHAQGYLQPNVTAGVHTLVVQYPGDTNDLPSTSPPVTFTLSSGSPTTVYSYNISSYQPNGNVQTFSDSVNGSWSDIQYDNLNRLTAATQNVSGQPTQYLCWTYDSFGNRLSQTVGTNPCHVAFPPPATSSVLYNSLNQELSTSPTHNVDCFDVLGNYLNTVAGSCYDAAGNVTAARSLTNPASLLTDKTNQYLYDAEGRVCAVGSSSMFGGVFMVQYIYDAEGRRVAKGTITTLSCDTSSNGFLQTASYILGPSGEQVTEIDGNGNWQHTNVYAVGQLIATYKNDASAGQAVTPGVHFHLADWLGTNRVQLTNAGQSEETCQSLSFGDVLNCTGVADSTEHHFTGKERDAESGLDYMDARYYGSSIGRFMSPDPLGGHPEDPQTLNRYAYARNNPLTFSDPTGLDFNLTCTAAKDGSNASTCQGGVQGTTTTANGKSTFTATVITSASLSDPKSGNTATVNENGVQITTAQGTSGAKFIDNTPAADINGGGKLADFSFHINGSCGGTCLDSGTFKFNGTPDQARDLLDQRGAFRSIVDRTIPGLGKSVDEMKYHPDTTQHRFGDDPSPHFSVPRDPKGTVPTVGPFHVDTNAPGLRHLGCATVGVGCN
jgi:RHS repeat-associated protein